MKQIQNYSNIPIDGKGVLQIIAAVKKDIILDVKGGSKELAFGLAIPNRQKRNVANFAAELFENINPANMRRWDRHVSVSASKDGSELKILFEILPPGENMRFMQSYFSHMKKVAKNNGMKFYEADSKGYLLEIKCETAREVKTEGIREDLPKGKLSGRKLCEILEKKEGDYVWMKKVGKSPDNRTYNVDGKNFEAFMNSVVRAIDIAEQQTGFSLFRDWERDATGIALDFQDKDGDLTQKLGNIANRFGIDSDVHGDNKHVSFYIYEYGKERKKKEAPWETLENILDGTEKGVLTGKKTREIISSFECLRISSFSSRFQHSFFKLSEGQLHDIAEYLNDEFNIQKMNCFADKGGGKLGFLSDFPELCYDEVDVKLKIAELEKKTKKIPGCILETDSVATNNSIKIIATLVIPFRFGEKQAEPISSDGQFGKGWITGLGISSVINERRIETPDIAHVNLQKGFLSSKYLFYGNFSEFLNEVIGERGKSELEIFGFRKPSGGNLYFVYSNLSPDAKTELINKMDLKTLETGARVSRGLDGFSLILPYWEKRDPLWDYERGGLKRGL